MSAQLWALAVAGAVVLAAAGLETLRARRARRLVAGATAVNAEDGTFKSPDELKDIYGGKGVVAGKEVIAYCRIGERSAHTWFVLHELLGVGNVKNYDGSWTEYGSLVGVPVQLGDEPGGPEGGAA